MSGTSGRYDPDSIQGLAFRFLNDLYSGRKKIEVDPKGFDLKSGFYVSIRS